MICFMSLYGQLVDVHGKPLPMNARSSTWSRPATFPKFRRQRSPFANTVTVELPRRSVGALACYPVHSEMSLRKSCRPRAAVVGRTGFVDARGNTPSFFAHSSNVVAHTGLFWRRAWRVHLSIPRAPPAPNFFKNIYLVPWSS